MKYHLADFLQQYDPAQIFVLEDDKLSFDIPYPVKKITGGEQAKNLAQAVELWQWLTEQGATRKALLINIGGGTICDIGGFVAATYLRGIDYINLPSTLLAMVDAGIGGKTGIDLDGLKNRVGAFHQPKAVYMHTPFLNTLPATEILSGFGEIFKCALLSSNEAFTQAINTLEQYITQPQSLISEEVISMAVAYKQHVVEEDPQEQGFRQVLNFGHTVGHAIEEKTGDKHGYCVVWGLIAEMYLSVILLGCPKEPLTRLTHTVTEYYGRPKCNCKDTHDLLDLMRKDKKNARANEINFTLLRTVGEPIINQTATNTQIQEAIDYLMSI